MASPARWRVRLLWCSAFALALAGCGGTDQTASGPGPLGTTATSPQAGSSASPTGQTFGTQPCAKLVSFEEIGAATGQRPAIVDVVSDGQCNYEDDALVAVLSVLLVEDPAGDLSCTAQDGTYLGGPVEQLSGIGDASVWSPSALSLCFVKGTKRVQISLSTQVGDPKAVTAGLAAKAAQRLS